VDLYESPMDFEVQRFPSRVSVSLGRTSEFDSVPLDSLSYVSLSGGRDQNIEVGSLPCPRVVE